MKKQCLPQAIESIVVAQATPSLTRVDWLTRGILDCQANDSFITETKKSPPTHMTRICFPRLENRVLLHLGIRPSVPAVLRARPLLFFPSLKDTQASSDRFHSRVPIHPHSRTRQSSKSLLVGSRTYHAQDHSHQPRPRQQQARKAIWIFEAPPLITALVPRPLSPKVFRNILNDFLRLLVSCDSRKVAVLAAVLFFHNMMSQHILRLMRLSGKITTRPCFSKQTRPSAWKKPFDNFISKTARHPATILNLPSIILPTLPTRCTPHNRDWA